MRVLAVDGGLRLAEAGNLTSFSVACPGGAAAAAATLAEHGAGGPADRPDHVLVRVDAVPRLAGEMVDDGWAEGFAEMLAYAASKGWVSDDGRSILAHVQSDGSASR